jgi:perosamine synthetase
MMIPHSRPSLGPAEAEAVLTVLRSGQIAQGPRVAQFEEGVARLIGMHGGVAVSSGTAALELALRGLGVSVGDEVILPSYVCPAPWLAITRVGAKARVVDIEPDSYAIDVARVGKTLSRRTRAIIVPHPFGLPADLTALQGLGVPLIEDCAQTLGATEAGRLVGSVGAVTVCSFYATKLLCTGEGGMVLSNDRALLDRVRCLREYDHHTVLRPAAFNYKMTDLHATLGLEQLAQLSSFIERRAAIAARYRSAWNGTGVQLPEIPKDRSHVFYRFIIRVDTGRRQVSLDRLLTRLEQQGVQCRRPVFRPLHRSLGLDEFPHTEQAQAQACSVPLYPSLTDEEVAQVISVVSEVLKAS